MAVRRNTLKTRCSLSVAAFNCRCVDRVLAGWSAWLPAWSVCCSGCWRTGIGLIIISSYNRSLIGDHARASRYSDVGSRMAIQGAWRSTGWRSAN